MGPQGTHTFEALQQYLSEIKFDVSYKQAEHTVTALFEALNSHKVDAIFVPIENSIGGEVVSSLDCLMEMELSLSITAELLYPVRQTLMALQPLDRLSDITDIFAHEQSFYQCDQFLKQHCPNARFHYCSSNGQAADIVSHNKYEFSDNLPHQLACIGSQSCQSIYGLTVLKSKINDIDTNLTRFILVSRNKTQLSVNNKTSMVFSTKQDTPGSLCSILMDISNLGVNMTRIVSRPTKKRMGDYMFYVDIEGHVLDPSIHSLIETIKEKTLWFKFLGSYERSLIC